MKSAVRAALIAASVAIAASACSTRVERVDEPAPGGDTSLIYQTQISVGSCIYAIGGEEAAPLAAIGTALLTNVIGQGVNHLGRAIAAAAGPTDDKTTATRNLDLGAEFLAKRSCVVIARGWFHTGFASKREFQDAADRADTGWAAPRGDKDAIDPERRSELWGRRMWLGAQPDFIFEAQIVQSVDKRALAFAPRFARLEAPVSQPRLRVGRERDVAVFIAFHVATADPAAPSNPSGGMVLGRLDPGIPRRFHPDPEPGRKTANRQHNESRWFTLTLAETAQPMAVTALVTEHQDPSAFGQFVAEVFTASAAPITTALQSAIVPDLRAKAEETEKAAQETANGAYDTAWTAALAAADACATTAPAKPNDTAVEVRSKIRAFNKTARVLNRPEVAEGDVPLGATAGALQSACVTVRDNIRGALR